MTAQTLVEKIIAQAAGVPTVRPGEIVTVAIDLAYAHDGSGPRRWQPLLDELGVGVHDPSKIAIVTDHYVPAVDAESASILQITRRFAEHHGIRHFFDMVGICHLVLPEHGLIRPGTMIAGGDSHTPMVGAFGTYAAGYGATDMAAIVATGRTWIKVPATISVEWSGALAPGVTAKDIMLFLCRKLGLDNGFLVIEFSGELVERATMEERMVLCNMAAELGCETGVVAPDETTFAYLAKAGRPADDPAALRLLASDTDARFAAVHCFDGATLKPQIAAPHSPANTADAASFAGVKVDQAYIGACVGAKLDDLHQAAKIMRGRQVAAGTRLLIAPASTAVTKAAASDGTLTTLLDAGATLLPSGCGACAGLGAGIIADGETCISSTNRNVRGRMGSASASVYLGSAYSVAAAAVAGSIVDPREMLLNE